MPEQIGGRSIEGVRVLALGLVLDLQLLLRQGTVLLRVVVRNPLAALLGVRRLPAALVQHALLGLHVFCCFGVLDGAPQRVGHVERESGDEHERAGSRDGEQRLAAAARVAAVYR